MRPIYHLIQRTLAFPFYQQHAGLLFFIFYVMFGLVESSQLLNYHQSLIYGILNSIQFLVIVLTIWLLYFLKCYIFVRQKCEAPDYHFINELSSLSKGKTFLLFAFLYLIIFLPVLIYTIAILTVAIKSGLYLPATTILLFQTSSLIICSWASSQQIHKRHLPGRFTIPSLKVSFNRPLFLFYISHLFKNQKIGILLSKLFSIVSIYIVLQAMDVHEDIRIPALVLLFGLIAHAFLIFDMKRFEDERLTWMRALPYSTFSLILNYLLVFTLILTPEMMLLAGSIGNKITLLNWVELYAFGIGFLAFIYIRLFKFVGNTDLYMQFILWVFLGTFFLIVCNLVPFLALLSSLGSFFIFRKRYYRYESQVRA
jgi:hypothetical protein